MHENKCIQSCLTTTHLNGFSPILVGILTCFHLKWYFISNILVSHYNTFRLYLLVPNTLSWKRERVIYPKSKYPFIFVSWRYKKIVSNAENTILCLQTKTVYKLN